MPAIAPRPSTTPTPTASPNDPPEAEARAAGGPALLVLAPMRIEAFALRRGVRRTETRVVRSGMGRTRSLRTAARLAADSDGSVPILIAGFAGALRDDLQPGDLVVADELRHADDTEPIRLSSAAEPVADVLRRRGLRALVGPIVSVERPASGPRRGQLADQTGALAVDMESAWLAAGLTTAGSRPAVVVVRAILDTPEREIWRPLATLAGVRLATRSLRRAAAAIEADWAPPGLR